mmetsp:Transcript_7849/g.10255  ORF Transcript_7849/g.10255 Transcript_7849/m.10255 type:complete len:140 (-) Transcript_7849:550-969(-)
MKVNVKSEHNLSVTKVLHPPNPPPRNRKKNREHHRSKNNHDRSSHKKSERIEAVLMPSVNYKERKRAKQRKQQLVKLEKNTDSHEEALVPKKDKKGKKRDKTRRIPRPSGYVSDSDTSFDTFVAKYPLKTDGSLNSSDY